MLWWASVFLIPVATRLGMSESAASKIPFVGFAVGLSIGFGFGRSRSVKDAVGYVALPLILGSVCWCLGLLVGGVFLVFGASESAADRVPTAGFGLGVAVGIVLLLLVGFEELRSLGKRFGIGRADDVDPK